MAKLRVGIVGYGVMGRNHLRILSKMQNIEVVGVCDTYINAIEVDSKSKLFKSLEDLITAGIDYAVVATPAETHFELCRLLADKKIPCLIEKPFTTNLTEATEICEVFSKNSVPAAIGYIERFNPAVIHARSLLEELGQIIQVSTRRQSTKPNRTIKIGAILDLATHDVDLTLHLTASQYSEFTVYKIEDDSKIVNSAVLSGRLRDGVIASHIVNWVSPFKDRNITLLGSNGALVINTVTSELDFFSLPSKSVSWPTLANVMGPLTGERISHSFEKFEPLLKEHEQFIDFIEGKESFIVNLREGLLVHQALSLLE